MKKILFRLFLLIVPISIAVFLVGMMGNYFKNNNPSPLVTQPEKIESSSSFTNNEKNENNNGNLKYTPIYYPRTFYISIETRLQLAITYHNSSTTQYQSTNAEIDYLDAQIRSDHTIFDWDYNTHSTTNNFPKINVSAEPYFSGGYTTAETWVTTSGYYYLNSYEATNLWERRYEYLNAIGYDIDYRATGDLVIDHSWAQVIQYKIKIGLDGLNFITIADEWPSSNLMFYDKLNSQSSEIRWENFEDLESFENDQTFVIQDYLTRPY